MQKAAVIYAGPLLTTIAASSITIVTFVFSTLMVVLQLASSQLSPRILRKTIREGRAQFVMGILVGTFVFAVRSLLLLYGTQDGLVALLLVNTGIVIMIVSVLSFLYFIGFVADRVRAPAVIRSIEKETEYWLRRIYRFEEPQSGTAQRPALESEPFVPLRARDSGSITGIDIRALVAWATRADAVVVLESGLGTQVTEKLGIGRVYYRGRDTPPRAVAAAISIEPERTIPGDPPWGFRILVDIAIRALSPAVNDPTTAVQVIDALEELLAVLGTRAEQPGEFFDATGKLRLVVPVMSWRAYLELSTHEIYQYGAESSQVTQRLVRMLDELDTVVTTDDRHASIREAREQIAVVSPMVSPQPACAQPVTEAR
jgi:uncharacterized membrane protein